MSFKRFLIWSSGDPPVRWSKTINAFLKRASWETFLWSYLKLGPVIQEEMLFKENKYWWTDGWTKTDHNSWPWAFGSGELKVDFEEKYSGLQKRVQIYQAGKDHSLQESLVLLHTQTSSHLCIYWSDPNIYESFNKSEGFWAN